MTTLLEEATPARPQLQGFTHLSLSLVGQVPGVDAVMVKGGAGGFQLS